MKNLALNVECIALALSEEGGYEYYHIDDDLKELKKDILDMQNENAELHELAKIMVHCMGEVDNCDTCRINDNPCEVSGDDWWFACDSLHERLRKCGVIE